MSFNSTSSLFQALQDGVVPALLGGTGKKPEISVDFYRWETFTQPSKYQLEVSELQSLITFMASNIAELEQQKTWTKEHIADYHYFMNEHTASNPEEVKTRVSEQLEEYIAIRNSLDKKLKQLRKIQTKLKRQRANFY